MIAEGVFVLMTMVVVDGFEEKSIDSNTSEWNSKKSCELARDMYMVDIRRVMEFHHISKGNYEASAVCLPKGEKVEKIEE